MVNSCEFLEGNSKTAHDHRAVDGKVMTDQKT